MHDNAPITHKQAQEILESLGTIKRAVLGEEEAGNTGLVTRVAKMEGKMRALDLRIASVAGAVGFAIFLIQYFWK